ncbi:HD-GYP domain-containing protein [Halobacillus yeomjeoni]|uniref:HD-GYP domain-containing protein n=1 Tax=Halobacillus yeomjeoni TaxID=311194 RepID=UPI001CD677B5|nr:HD-GYP domain-containing protein [Halobacillus yeomjeoni]MCA0984909.1 HD-GYP domain-containing protein [Halobacillus yeomjeoni]
MQVHPSQLVPGCIITKDIIGKTGRPIIPNRTVVSPIHIRVLEQFLVEEVEVADKLSDGTLFTPRSTDSEEENPVSNEPPVAELTPFYENYLEAVQSYKRWFKEWQHGDPVDLLALRKVMVPLLEEAVESGKDVFKLHHYSSSGEYLYHHNVAMGLISAYLAEKMGYKYGEWIQIGLAATLCDAGMSQIDPTIIWKEGSILESEYAEIKKHPLISFQYVESTPYLSKSVKLAILQHHERLDGSGYPIGLKADKIHPFSQIIAVSDIYHAMTCERIYRVKQSPYKALEEILQKQFGRYDHRVIQVMVKELTDYSTGTKVRLSNKQTAEVMFVDQSQPTRPMVRLEEGSIFQLKEQRHLHIEEVIG